MIYFWLNRFCWCCFPDSPHPDNEVTYYRTGRTFFYSGSFRGLQQPDLWLLRKRHSNQNRDLHSDRIHPPVEPGALQRAASKVSRTWSTEKSAETEKIYSYSGHRGSRESQGVPWTATTEPRSPWNLLKDGHWSQTSGLIFLGETWSLHQWVCYFTEQSYGKS